MHHIALAYPFLVVCLFQIGSLIGVRRMLTRVFIALFVAINISLYTEIPLLKPRKREHPSKIRINSFVNQYFSCDHVVVVIDWGLYYIKTLYGPKNQCVLYIEPFNTGKQVERLRNIQYSLSRKALFLGLENSVSDLSLIKTEFPAIEAVQMPFDTGKWRVWLEK